MCAIIVGIIVLKIMELMFIKLDTPINENAVYISVDKHISWLNDILYFGPRFIRGASM